MGIAHRVERKNGAIPYTHVGAVMNGGVGGLSVEQGIPRQRHTREQAHVGIKSGVEEGPPGSGRYA
jgi:hypothetical protein